jgi:hypothetical protein
MTLATIDLVGIQHKPTVRSPRGHEQDADPVAALMGRVAELRG